MSRKWRWLAGVSSEVVADNNCNINVNTPACFYRELVDIRQLTELFAQYRP